MDGSSVPGGMLSIRLLSKSKEGPVSAQEQVQSRVGIAVGELGVGVQEKVLLVQKASPRRHLAAEPWEQGRHLSADVLDEHVKCAVRGPSAL